MKRSLIHQVCYKYSSLTISDSIQMLGYASLSFSLDIPKFAEKSWSCETSQFNIVREKRIKR
jgi:hypothetical protein